MSDRPINLKEQQAVLALMNHPRMGPFARLAMEIVPEHHLNTVTITFPYNQTIAYNMLIHWRVDLYILFLSHGYDTHVKVCLEPSLKDLIRKKPPVPFVERKTY